MKWSSSAKPGLRRAVAGLAGSADQTRIEGGPKTAPPRQRRPLVSGRSPRIAMRDEAAEPVRDRPLRLGCCWIMAAGRASSRLPPAPCSPR